MFKQLPKSRKLRIMILNSIQWLLFVNVSQHVFRVLKVITANLHIFVCYPPKPEQQLMPSKHKNRKQTIFLFHVLQHEQ